jgi:hypothetical protein
MDEASQIAIITAGASIAGGFVGQMVSIYYQSRVNKLERTRLIEARASQLYLREIQAYDQLVPGMAGLLYTCRELLTEKILREPMRSDPESQGAYERIQHRVREAVDTHFLATASNYHVIGADAIQTIDREARRLFNMIDEVTGPLNGKPPMTEDQVKAMMAELEEMRQRVLRFCWESLDVTHLEASFRDLKHPEQHETTRLPSIIGMRFGSRD